MTRKEKFINFMESMKTESNAMLLEAIKAGFNATSLFEGMDTLEIGSCPYSEDCAQVGSDDYQEKSKKELHAYANQLIRMFGQPPEGARLFIKANPHDFGTYHELACKYNEDNEEATQYAYKLEGEGPEFWDAEAKKELGIIDEAEEPATKYETIVYMQGDDARPYLEKLENGGSDEHKAVIEELKQWETGEGEVSEDKPWGSKDEWWEEGDYVLSYNNHLDYISLTKIIKE